MSSSREHQSVAVIGAGLSGLACGRRLALKGYSVRVFDKGRGVGGRMSVRRRGRASFDHGAQYFTVREPRFASLVRSWHLDGVVERWSGRIVVVEKGRVRSTSGETERWVGVPGMNAPCRHLARDLDVRLSTRVEDIESRDGRFRLWSDEGEDLGSWGSLVVSAPAEQTADLLEPLAPELARRARDVELAPCWAVLVTLDSRAALGFDGAFVHGSPLAWMARGASKPGRGDVETWVLHASSSWSQENLERPADEICARLLDAARVAVAGWPREVRQVEAHRWRFALPVDPLPEPCLFDRVSRIVACGDWCGGPRVEGAFLSGTAAADRLAGSLEP